MDVIDSKITDRYAVYNGDCIDVMKDLPDSSVHLSVYSPPFCGLYQYSSSERDLSNCANYKDFFTHYDFVVQEIKRLTQPGRFSAVHCMPTPLNGANCGGFRDFPGDIIKLHEANGFDYWGTHYIWKEPLEVRNKTMSKGLAHKTIVDDSSLCNMAVADHLVMFRRKGENKTAIAHPTGLHAYAGQREVQSDLLRYKGWTGKQTENRFSHWIWRQYASSVWDDVRNDRCIPFREGKEGDDERHIHPLQLDVIERVIALRSNPDELVLTPFMGVGSECYGALLNGRRAIGMELKPSYYKQAVKNLESVLPVKSDATFFDNE